ncbi:hypothetical protein ABZ819_05180 [Streptomyces venezuelae]|uniref:hypothetical protein n=1 Tax=Streptomyces venezuelae TaxID=54571 RepID=UPI00341E737E
MNKKLAAAIARDDQLEDSGMHGDDRKTCHTHQCWSADCEDQHSTPTAGSLLAAAIELDRTQSR